MRFLSLDLLAFGPFTRRRIDLSGGEQGLHLVYGPNEAGKSSALRAVADALFGFERSTGDDFLHNYRELRVGASVRGANNETLSFVRRKGKSATLREPDDITVVEDARLASFLAGVGRETFLTAFGVDQRRLQEGGRDILKGKGDIGRILFAAGAGLASVRQVQEALASESEKLYLPSGKIPPLNAGLTALERLRKALREALLPESKWSVHTRALDKARSDKAEIHAALERRQIEKGRLQRIEEALPFVGQWRELCSELAALRDARLLPEDFSMRRREAELALIQTRKDRERIEERLRDIDRDLESLSLPMALIERGQEAERLNQDWGSHKKAIQDRAKLEGERKHALAEADRMAAQLPGATGRDEVLRFRLNRAEETRLHELANGHAALVQAEDTVAGERAALHQRKERLSERLAALPRPREATALERGVDRARREGGIEEQLGQENFALQREEQDLERGLAAQRLWQPGPEGPTGLLRLALPSPETVDAHEARLNALEAEAAGLAKEAEDLVRKGLDLEAALHGLALEGLAPSEEELNAARLRRETGWSLLRPRLERGERAFETDGNDQAPHSDEAAFIALFPPAASLAEAYENSVAIADGLADRLRREAGRVAKRANLEAERIATNGRLALAQAAREKNASAMALAGREWAELWAPCEVVPLSPREMRRFSQDMKVLAGLVAAAAERRAKIEVARERVAGHERALFACLRDLAIDPTLAAGGLDALLGVCARELERLRGERERRAALQNDLDLTEESLAAARTKASMEAARRLAWRANWEEAVKPLGLTVEATPGQALAVLRDVQEVAECLYAARGYKERIDGIDRDAKEFEARLRSLAKDVAPDLVGFPLEGIAPALQDRFGRAREEAARRKQLQAARRKEQADLDEARIAGDHSGSLLDQMLFEAGCAEEAQLPEAEERSKRRRTAEAELAAVENRLRSLAVGQDMEAFVAAAEQEDPDALRPRIERLAADIGETLERLSVLDQAIGQEKTILAGMDGGAEAARLAQESQEQLAAVEELAEEYSRLRLAGLVLDRAVKVYRDKNQGPILERAGELFRRLTLGSFQGLRLDYDDAGAVLVGARPSGSLVKVEGMSEGTADQLFLAFRLASLEHWTLRNEPLPFIIDDILVNFDDARAGAALEILAELSGRVQIVFFTHHRHLVELAKARLNPGPLFVHSLDAA